MNITTDFNFKLKLKRLRVKMCDRNYSWRKDLKWNLKWNHSVHSKANSNVIIALFSTFGGLILLFLIWLYYEHRKSANITENCRRLGKSLPNHGCRDRKSEPVHRSNQKIWTIKSGPLVWNTMLLKEPVLLEGWNLINFSLS